MLIKKLVPKDETNVFESHQTGRESKTPKTPRTRIETAPKDSRRRTISNDQKVGSFLHIAMSDSSQQHASGSVLVDDHGDQLRT